MNDDLKTYLQTMGIERHLTAAYTPQQNGVAERINRTLMEAARSMLHAANLPSSFWTYAVHAAVYLRNRSPTRALNNVTPYEAWRGEKPSLSHLRVFGCRAFMYLHKRQRSSTNKLVARAMPGIFVGYATEAKAWLVWDPVDKKVHTTRDAKFMEGVPGSAPVPPTQSPVLATEPTSISSDNDSESAEAAEPMDMHTERSTIIDPLIIADDESDTDSEVMAEPTAPAEPAAAVEPAAALLQPAADQPIPVSSSPPATHAAAVGAAVSTAVQQPKKQKTRRLTEAERLSVAFNHHGNLELKEMEGPTLFAFAVQVGHSIGEPRSYKEATRGPHRAQWEQAMQEELDSITANSTYEIVPLPAGRRAIGCKWVYKIKRRADGSIDRYKARLVAKGYSQLYGIDFTETFAPVVRFSSLRAILALAAAADYEIHQMDVKTAFLNGDLDEDIYMQQPDGHRADGAKADHVWKLNKSLYGLKQAGRAWNQKIHTALVELGFTSLHSDSCVYVKRDGSTVMYVLVYVDDLLLVTNDMAQLTATKTALSGRFDMKDMGEAHFILGVQITRDRARRQLLAVPARVCSHHSRALRHAGLQGCAVTNGHGHQTTQGRHGQRGWCSVDGSSTVCVSSGSTHVRGSGYPSGHRLRRDCFVPVHGQSDGGALERSQTRVPLPARQPGPPADVRLERRQAAGAVRLQRLRLGK